MKATITRAELFCRVIDNYGDIGVCWRMAKQLQARGIAVRLWVDDASSLAWMAPDLPSTGIAVQVWPDESAALPPDLQLGDLVIEAFGCELPQSVQARIAQQTHAAKAAHTAQAAHTAPPVWINLEYLSAENYVERCHRLQSPVMAGAAKGLTKWFFYPGFTPQTGGLLRETDLAQRQAAFDRTAWLNQLLTPLGQTWHSQRVVTLFCYDFESYKNLHESGDTPIPKSSFRPSILNSLLQQLKIEPTLLLLTHGKAQAAWAALHAHQDLRSTYPNVHAVALPALTQADFDHLLWASDLNFVRGEDSLVRAIWAGKPLVWQIYPQHDNAHHTKLDAFLHMAQQQSGLDVRHWQAVHHVWNGICATTDLPTLDWDDLAQQAQGLRQALLLQDDLVTQLLAFADTKRHVLTSPIVPNHR